MEIYFAIFVIFGKKNQHETMHEGHTSHRERYPNPRCAWEACGHPVRRLLRVTPQDHCARCLLVIRSCCHVISLHVSSCHVIMCIAFSCFKNLHSSGFLQFFLLSVLSPDTLARACGMSEILFYKWPENVLEMG